MSLSPYLEHLVKNGMLEVEAAEILNERYAKEEDQKRGAEKYLEEKKALIARLKSQPQADKAAPAEENVQIPDYEMGDDYIQINRSFNVYEWTLEEWLESISEDLYEFMEEHPCLVCNEVIEPDAAHPIHPDCRRLTDWRRHKRLLEAVKKCGLPYPNIDVKLAEAIDAVRGLESAMKTDRELKTGLWNLPPEKRAAAYAQVLSPVKVQGDFKEYNRGNGHN